MSRSRLVPILLGLLSTSQLVPVSRGQLPPSSNTTATPIPGAGHDYIGGFSEVVNPANGSLSIRTPVIMPPGRGITLPFSFAYDSSGVNFLSNNGSLQSYWFTTSTVVSQAGWSDSAPIISASQITWQTLHNGGPTKVTCKANIGYVFQDAHGGRHNMNLTTYSDPNGTGDCTINSSDWPLGFDGLFITQGGEGSIQATMPANQWLSQAGPVTVTDADGTAFAFGNHTVGSWPSGSYTSTWLPSSVTDRNGNTINLGGTSPAFSYVDTAGRAVLQDSGFAVSPENVTVSGLGAPYTLSWTTLSSPSFTTSITTPVASGTSACPTPAHSTWNTSQNHAVSNLTLPNGKSFSFTYDSTYGLVNRINYPSGGYVRYVWGMDSNVEYAQYRVANNTCTMYYAVPAVTDRYVSFDGTNEVLHQNFSYSTVWDPAHTFQWTTKKTIVTTYDLVRNTSFQTVYTYSPVSAIQPPNMSSGLPSQIPVESTIKYYSDLQVTLVKTVTKGWANERLLTVEETTYPNGEANETKWNYDTNEMQTEQDDYDYGTTAPPNPPGPLLRKTVTTYATNATFAADHIVDKPSKVQVYDSSGTTLAAETDYTYDSPAGTATSGIVQHNGGCNCGNLTQQAQWVDSSGTNKLVTNYINDDTGQRLSMTDPRGNQTSYSYTDSYSSGTPPGATNAYLTQVTYPNTGVAHIEKFSYAYASGEVTSSTDQNNLVTSYKYVDNLARLTEIDYPTPDGGVTTYTYTDTPNAVSVETKKKIDATRWTDAFALYDGLGQPIAHSAANGEATPWDRTDACYDGTGRVRFSSYPYQVSTATTAPNCTSGVGDTMTYDSLGRTIQVSHSDGNTILTSYTGRATQVQDEGNGTHRVQRISQIDGLGRLASMCEVTSSSQLGNGGTPAPCPQDISFTGFLTSYSYTALGDLLSVTQGTLASRSFSYDFLSRLTSATNPESGTNSYVYDTDPAAACPTPYAFAGLLVKKLDARGVRTCYQYVDALNRMTQKNYSDGTPTATFNFDQTSAYGVTLLNTTGRLTSQSTASPNPTGEVFSYDQLGRVKTNSQCTPQNCSTPAVFPVTYTYDLLGNMLTSTNGAGVTLTYAVNSAVRLTSLTSSLSDSNHPGTLFSSPHYNAAGALLSATLGGSIGETRTYDARLRLASIADGSNYSLTIPSSGGYAPNGDILAANDSVNANWVYAYDDFNRLTCSNLATNGTCASPSSGIATYTYDYDRYGNRWHQNGAFSMQLSFSGNNNRMDSHSYDAAGNLLNDGSHNYFYDAESRVIQLDGTLGTCSSATACYVYNASGQRVRKTTGSTSVDYLYDPSQQEITEISSAGAWNRGEVYAGGRHLATYKNGTTALIHADWLGTERVRTTAAGATCETITSLPFGDGQVISGSCGDPSPLHFTGKERDSESGLDNFGARYFGSSMGRFMTPEWSTKPQGVPYAVLDDPQSLNLYSYVRNNPVSLTDPDGHCWQKFFGQKLCNWFDWGHLVDNAHLDAALQKDADKARADIASTKNMTLNGKSPQDYANGLTNQQAILAKRALVMVLAGMAMNNLASPCGNSHISCGIVLPLGLGSTGRAVAADLREQLAMEEVMADPKGTRVPITMNDKRWPASQGWVKMTQTVNGVKIHWVENTLTGAVDDFKFK